MCKKTVQHILELGHELHFVKQHIVHFFVLCKVVHKVAKLVGVAVLLVSAVVEGNFQYVIVVHFFLPQVIVKQFKQQKGFAATSYAGNYLYHSVVLVANQFAQVYVALNYHCFVL